MRRGRDRYVVGALLVLRGATAHAQVPASARLALTWSAPSECPTRAAVLRALDRLRAPTLTTPMTVMRASAAVRRDDDRWRLDVRTLAHGTTSQRRLVATTCAQAVDAAALILALALDAPAAVEAPVASPPPPAPPVRFALRASFALDVGTLPKSTAGVDLAGALLWRDLRVEASVAYWFARSAVNGDGLGGEVGLVAGALRGCYVAHRGAIEPRLCGAVEGGSMMGRSVGLAPVGAGASPWWALSVGAVLAVTLSPRLALQSTVDAVVPVSSPDFVIDGLGVVHQPGTVSFRGSFGVEWRFP